MNKHKVRKIILNIILDYERSIDIVMPITCKDLFYFNLNRKLFLPAFILYILHIVSVQ